MGGRKGRRRRDREGGREGRKEGGKERSIVMILPALRIWEGLE